MATKSILKDVDIRDRDSAILLINAMEKASKKKAKSIEISRSFSESNNPELLRSIIRDKQ